MNDRFVSPSLGRDYWQGDAQIDRTLADLSSSALDDAQFRLLADYLPTLCWLANGDGYIVWYNRRWHDYCGTTPEQMEGWGWRSVHDPRLLPEIELRWAESVASGEPFEMTFPLRGADGVFRPFLTRIVPVRDASGRIARWVGMNVDVSDQVEAERRAADGEGRMRAALEQMPIGVSAAYVPSGAFVFLNETGAHMLGTHHAPKDLDDYRGFGAEHPDGTPYGPEQYPLARASMKGETVIREPMLYRRPDGRLVRLEVSAARVFDGEGRPVLAICSFEDVTEHDRATRLLETFVEAVPGVVYGKDLQGRMLLANKGTADLVGKPVPEILGKTDAEFLDDPDQATAVMANDSRIMASGKFEQIEEEVSFPDGRRAVWLSTKAPLRDAAGQVIGLVGSSVDITARKEAEAALADSEERFRFALDAAGGIGTWDWDVRADVVRTSAQFARMYGIDPVRAEAGLPVAEYVAGIYPEDRDEVSRLIDAALTGDGEFRAEYRILSVDGDVHWVVARGRCFRDAQGSPIRFPGVTFDITERKRAEDALREVEERYRMAALATNDAIWDWHFASNHVLWNEALERSYGHKLAEVEATGEWWIEHIHPDDRGRIDASIHAAIDGDADSWTDEYRFRRADGGYADVLDRGHIIRDASGRAVRMIGAMLDLTERRRTERALHEAVADLQATFDAVPAAVWIARDPSATRVDGNRAARELLRIADDRTNLSKSADGAGATVGHFTIYGPDGQELAPNALPVQRAARGEVVRDYEERIVFNQGQEVALIGNAVPLFDAGGRPRGSVAAFVDVSARKRAEEELRALNADLEHRIAAAIAEREKVEEALRQSQKMEAVGQLTGGIAHDFNNLLTVVTGNIDMTSRALEAAGVADPRAKRALEAAMKGAERAAALTQRLLAFSRRQPLAPKAIDADRLVSGMSDLLNRALGETVRLEIVTSPGLWRTEADPNQLESAILNLAVNARDAMPGGGTLTIETANVRLDDEYAANHAEVAPGQYVVIAVTDTGSGMSRDTLGRVFEPFFTTKEVGKGTGLGLSQVYGFTKQSGGHVKIYSEEGQGTTVKIYLPRLISEGEAEASGSVTGGLEVSRRRETILAVEDDDDVRAYTVECLRELGYRVLEAHDGPSAIRLMERQAEPIDLLFTDVVMPGMSGRELTDELRKRQPDLRVLYTSGYTRNAIVHGGRLDEGVEMIAKPFTFQALAAKVRDMLEAGATRRVLVVEGEPTMRAFMTEALGGIGYVVSEAAAAAEALMMMRAAQGRYDAVVFDADLADKPGDALAAEFRALHADMPLLIVSGDRTTELAEQLAADRCLGVLPKPYTGAKLTQALRDLGVRCGSLS